MSQDRTLLPQGALSEQSQTARAPARRVGKLDIMSLCGRSGLATPGGASQGGNRDGTGDWNHGLWRPVEALYVKLEKRLKNVRMRGLTFFALPNQPLTKSLYLND